jgi:ubiquinol-cytochrome c reductase cytochrome c1 subunit
MRMRSLIAAGALALGLATTAQAVEGVKIPSQNWGFEGMFGTFDRAALQRGFLVYKEVCAACHSLNLIRYRELSGIGFNEDQVKAIAASAQIVDGPNDSGEMFERPGRPADRFRRPFANDNAARAANNGALPPDLSLIAESRVGGPNYLYALLTGYKDQMPAGKKNADGTPMKMLEGMHYNDYFPGHQIGMAPPLSNDRVTYADGTKATVERMASDLTTFLTWTAEPNLEHRKALGIKVMLFLLVLSVLLYVVKRKVWADVAH